MPGWTCALPPFGGQSLAAPTRASMFQFDLPDALWQHRGDMGGRLSALCHGTPRE